MAYSNVLRFFTYGAVAASALLLVLAVLVPDKVLPDSVDSLAHKEETDESTKVVEREEERRS
jgi:hypothetical protein